MDCTQLKPSDNPGRDQLERVWAYLYATYNVEIFICKAIGEQKTVQLFYTIFEDRQFGELYPSWCRVKEIAASGRYKFADQKKFEFELK